MLKKIAKVMMAVIDGAAKVIAVLLWVLGMWIPALYSVLFFVVCSVSGIAVEGGAVTVYFVGLGIAAALGLMFAFWRLRSYGRKKNAAIKGEPMKKRAAWRKRQAGDSELPSYEKEIRPDRQTAAKARRSAAGGADEDPVADAPTHTKARRAAQAQNTDSLGSLAGGQAHTGDRISAYRDDSDLREKYFSARLPTAQSDDSARGNTDASVAAGRADTLLDSAANKSLMERLRSAQRSEESPLVFATRTDPNVFIYEYSDRLEYWRKTRRGMMLLGSEPKKNSYLGR